MILGIYGAGGLGREVYGFASALNRIKQRWDEIVYIDDADIKNVDGNKHVYKFDKIINKYSRHNLEIVIAQGEPLLRKKLCNKVESHNYSLAALIHHNAVINNKTKIEEGVVINSDKITISPDVIIGKNTYIQPFVAIGHDTAIGRNCVVSAFSSIAGNCSIGNNVYISMHTAIKEGISIGNNCIIGMGSIVFRDVPDNFTVFNNSTRMVKHEFGSNVFGEKR